MNIGKKTTTAAAKMAKKIYFAESSLKYANEEINLHPFFVLITHSHIAAASISMYVWCNKSSTERKIKKYI